MSCLTTETLERMELGFLQDERPAWSHVKSCAPCARQLKALRKEHEVITGAARLIESAPAQRTSPFMAFLWKPLAMAALVHVVLLAGLWVLVQNETESSVDDNDSWSHFRFNYPEYRLPDVERARDIVSRSPPSQDDLDEILREAPVIFSPVARETDHNESADGEDFHQMKGESRDFLSYIKGDAVGFRGRATGTGRGGRAQAQAQAGRRPNVPERGEGMTFKDQGSNPVVQTAVEPQSTFGLDVDTASYTKIRDFLMRGVLPPKEAVRVEECLNYFRYADPKPAKRPFRMQLEAAPSPFDEKLHLLRIAIQAKEISKHERKNVHLTFVIDVSGSMGMENRLGLVKKSLEVLIGQLRATDRIGIVVYGSSGRKLLDPTVVAQKEKILAAIQGLHTEGSTNLEEGVNLGYDLAAQYFDPEATNRVVICTDGVANNGVTDPVILLRNVKEKSGKGIWLSVFGFGMDNYNDDLMVKLADKGNGNYAYIDDFQEAKKLFNGKLSGLFEVVAADAKVQVEFDPATVTSWRLVGYEKRRLENQDFRNDKIDAGELGAGHHVTALYELSLKPGGEGRVATVRLRYKQPDTQEVIETQESIGRVQVLPTARDASPSYRLAAAVAQFAEILRESPHATGVTLAKVREQASEASADLDRPEDAVEFVELVKRAAALKK
jgi:Ca-activated chloride channel family protein